MRLTRRVVIAAALLLASACTESLGDAPGAGLDGGLAADGGSAADGGPGSLDGGPDGPTRYVDFLFDGEDLVVVRDILYAIVDDEYGTHRLRLDLYRPSSEVDPVGQRPVIVWVHGGRFQTGDRTQMAGYARELARRGWVAVSIEYRLLKALDPSQGPQAAAEVAQEDVDAAMAYLRAHAGEHGIDPSRFVVGGFSAGSITSFQVGYRYEDAGHPGPTVLGVAAIEGLLIGPSDFAAGDPPFILVRSSEPVNDGDGEETFDQLLEAADALGIASDMVVMPDTVHVDLISPDLIPAISAIVAPFLHTHALAGAAI